MTVWECDIRHHFKQDLPRLIDAVEAGILRGKTGKMSLRIYEEQGNKVLLVAEETVEYERSPTDGKSENH